MATQYQEGTVLVNTIADNKLGYSGRNYYISLVDRKLQARIRRPGYKDYVNIVDNGLLQKCPLQSHI